MKGYPEEWIRELNRHFDFITDPAGRCAELSRMARELHGRREIGDVQLQEMLELADAGREWALVEHEEAWAIGLFKIYPPSDTPGKVHFETGTTWIET